MRRSISARWMPDRPIGAHAAGRICPGLRQRLVCHTHRAERWASIARSLVITDTFGVRTLIKSSGERPNLFHYGECSSTPYARQRIDRPAHQYVFPAAVAAQELGEPPVEEVLFLRDEMANLAWAVERLIESPAERPLNRFETYPERNGSAHSEAAAMLRRRSSCCYHLSTEIPDYWIPLMPVRKPRAAAEARRGAQDGWLAEPAYASGEF